MSIKNSIHSSTKSKYSRLQLNLPSETYESLRRLSAETGRSMTDIVKTSLALTNLVISERAKKNTLAIANEEGNVVKEIVLPDLI